MPRKPKQRAHAAGEYVLTLLLVAMVTLLAWAVWGIAKKEAVARKAVESRKAELAILKDRRAAFETSLAELSTDRGQEATLRHNHGVAKAGEEVIIVVPPEEDELEPRLSPWKRFLGWFGIW